MFHNNLITLMQALGYPADNEGVCFGFACMGIQAVVTGNIDKFEKRCDLIEQLDSTKISEYARQILELSNSNADIGKSSVLTAEQKQQLIDLKIFCEDVELNYQPGEHQDWFTNRMVACQDMMRSMSLTQSGELEAKGGLQEIGDVTLALHDTSELLDIFRMFSVIHAKQPSPTKQDPVGIMVSSANHATASGFDGKFWYMMDPDDKPVIRTPELKAFVNKAASVGSGKFICLSLQFYSHKNSYEFYLDIYKKWKQGLTDKKYLEVSAQKIKNFDNGVKWLITAAAVGDYHLCEELLKHGVDPNQCRSSNQSALYLAAENNYLSVVELLLDHKAKIDIKDADGDTPLMLAAKYGYDNLVNVLLARGADPTHINCAGKTALVYAKEGGHASIYNLLEEHLKSFVPMPSKKSKKKKKKTAAFATQALSQSDGSVLSALPLLPTFKQINQDTSLMKALKERDFEKARSLVDSGADLLTVNARGESPLYLAIDTYQFDLAQIILEKNAVRLEPATNGFSLMQIAVLRGAHDIALALLHKGARIDEVDKHGNTLFNNACQHCPKFALELMDHDVDINTQNFSGESPFMMAANYGGKDNASLVEKMIANNVNFKGRNKDDQNVLDNANPEYFDLILSYMLSHGYDINEQDKKGKTLLMSCVENQYTRTVEQLIRLGASIEIRDNAGKSALDYTNNSSLKSNMKKWASEKLTDPNALPLLNQFNKATTLKGALPKAKSTSGITRNYKM